MIDTIIVDCHILFKMQLILRESMYVKEPVDTFNKKKEEGEGT